MKSICLEIPGTIATSSASTHGGLALSQSACCVFLCLKSGYLTLTYDQKSTSNLISHAIFQSLQSRLPW
jgi:hypothetical protein